MEKLNISTDSFFLSDYRSDILLLGSAERLEMERMIKETYVKAHHKAEIFKLETRNCWKTYIGTPRKGVTRKNRSDLIDYLYCYYKESETASYTVLQVFERSEEYRRTVQNRAIGTLNRDRQVFYRFFEKTFYNRLITSITADEIAEYFNRRTKELQLTERALRDTKQVLGRIFQHAILHEKIISSDPVQLDLEDYFQNCTQKEKTADEKIFTMDEIAQIQTEARARLKTEGYDPYLYAILFSILTGVRAGEIPTLRWSDLSDMGIHIHTQQRIIRREGDSRLLEELPFTKNERRHPRGGRYFPVYDELQTLLNEIREQQDIDGIHSEFIFCCADGAWINKESYEQKLRRLCRKLDFT